jgi:hypothetical protein
MHQRPLSVSCSATAGVFPRALACIPEPPPLACQANPVELAKPAVALAGRLLGFCQQAIADAKIIGVGRSVFRRTDDRLAAHVERGVDQHGVAGPPFELLEQPVEARVGLAMHRLQAGGVVDTGRRAGSSAVPSASRARTALAVRFSAATGFGLETGAVNNMYGLARRHVMRHIPTTGRFRPSRPLCSKAAPNSRHEREEQECRKNHQMDCPLHHVSATGAESDSADQER